MRISEFYIETKKTGAGHYLITVTDESNNKIRHYTETDMQVIDALTDEEGMYDLTQSEAMQLVIEKSGI